MSLRNYCSYNIHKIAIAKILVIDDEPSIVHLVSAYLKPEGYEVLTANDGPSGFKVARAFKPDLIILNLMLPGMDGIELLSRLRRESDVYVILLTAKTEETAKVVGLSVGFVNSRLFALQWSMQRHADAMHYQMVSSNVNDWLWSRL